MTTLMNTYGPRSLTLVKGEGSRVWDDKGNSYLDAISGIAVCGLGYSHPAVTQAISHQAATLIHCSNYYNIPSQQKLADFKRPRAVYFLSELPRVTLEKVAKNKLRELADQYKDEGRTE